MSIYIYTYTEKGIERGGEVERGREREREIPQCGHGPGKATVSSGVSTMGTTTRGDAPSFAGHASTFGDREGAAENVRKIITESVRESVRVSVRERVKESVR